MISRLPQILPKQNIDFVHFLCTNILNWPLNLHGKKALPCQNPSIEWHRWALQIQIKTLHATIRGSIWQRSDPMAYRHRQSDSTPMMLGDPVGAAIIFQAVTTLLKCRGSTCAHWCPSSWWRSRRFGCGIRSLSLL